MSLLSTALGTILLEEAEHVASEVIDLSITGNKSPELERKLFRKISQLLKNHRYAKIGKTANAKVRFGRKDYITYHTMYLLYSTTSKKNIAHYESTCITKFRDKLDNQHANSSGREPHIPKRYYMYLVVQD